MTKQMQPGPELDATIAERVMGWERHEPLGRHIYWVDPDRTRWLTVPWHSSHIGSAWKVVERLAPEMIAFDIREEWTACRMIGKTFGIIERKGNDVPHSICLTALAVMEALQ